MVSEMLSVYSLFRDNTTWVCVKLVSSMQHTLIKNQVYALSLHNEEISEPLFITAIYLSDH